MNRTYGQDILILKSHSLYLKFRFNYMTYILSNNSNLGINPTKYVQDLYATNYTTLMEETKDLKI